MKTKGLMAYIQTHTQLDHIYIYIKALMCVPLCVCPKAFQIKRKSCILLSYIFCNEGQECVCVCVCNFSPIVLTFFSMMEEHHTALIDDIRNGLP